jgi:hypothetical protein
MFAHEERPKSPLSAVELSDTLSAPLSPPTGSASSEPASATAAEAGAPAAEAASTDGRHDDWHAEAGRKGARRRQQLIEQGRLYEQEHGLKRGRQRIRQLIEMGKRYEYEHGHRPRRARTEHLGRGQRKELVTNLLRYLIRLAKPSFRLELSRLVQKLHEEEGRAA